MGVLGIVCECGATASDVHAPLDWLRVMLSCVRVAKQF